MELRDRLAIVLDVDDLVLAQRLGRLLKREKLSYKRTHRRLKHKQDPAQVAEKRAELDALEKGETPVGWTSAISTRPASPPPPRRPTVGGR